MPRPVGKTIRHPDWDDDESVTFRTSFGLLESQQVLEWQAQAREIGRFDTAEKADLVARIIAKTIMVMVVPGKFRVHPADSDPDDTGIRPWVLFAEEAIAAMALTDLFFIFRRGEEPAAAPAQEEEHATAPFPGDDEHAALNGASATPVQAAV